MADRLETRLTVEDREALERIKARSNLRNDSEAVRLLLGTLSGEQRWITPAQYKAIRAGLSDADLDLRLTHWLLNLAERYVKEGAHAK